VLRGHVPEAVARLGLMPVGRLPATNRLNLAIGLPLRNTNALNQLLQDMYGPASPQFRHYLTPEQFTEQFGPTKQDYEAVVQFAKSQGLDITVMHSNRVLLDVAGQVADIEKAFQVTLHTYQHPAEARQFYAPDVEPSVEAGLAVLDISGLNNYARPRPASYRTSGATSAGHGSGSGPNGSFMGKDFRNAYAPGVTLTGAGQMVGLVELNGFYAGDITTYETMAGLPNVPIQVVLLDGFNGIPVTSELIGVVEASLDIEMAISMAPGLSKVVVFDAGANGVFNDILNAIAANPQIKQLSSSFGGFAQNATSDQIFQQIAVQGQSFFLASFDGDSWVNSVINYTYPYPYNYWPSDNPYVTSVGGTSLTMNGSGASYASERVWNDGNIPPGWAGSAYVGSGGGISPLYPIPSWQKGLDMSANRGSTTRRNFPDVAMVAENFVIVANGSTSSGWTGTSFATPLWAGFTALVNQEAAANGQPPVGFLNPALYALGQSADYTNNFHDITVGNNATDTSGGLFPAVPGYDLCTGWGSPQGSNLRSYTAAPPRDPP
jgi:subtilase family serine protease